MHLAELSNTQSRTLYSHLSDNSVAVHKRSPKVHKRPDLSSTGRVFNIEKDTLYATKCICVLSQVPLVRTFERILVYIHTAVVSEEEPEMALEAYIYNLLHEVPLPPPGRSLKFSVMGKTIVGQRPGMTSLILLYYDIPLNFFVFKYSFVL